MHTSIGKKIFWGIAIAFCLTSCNKAKPATEPAEAAKPADAAPQADAAKPAEAANPDDAANPNDAANPTGAANPANAAKPADAAPKDALSAEDRNALAALETQPLTAAPLAADAQDDGAIEKAFAAFAPDTTPMNDDAEAWAKKARKYDTHAIFILSMMYRDRIGNAANVRDGKKQATALTDAELFRETIRWNREIVSEDVDNTDWADVMRESITNECPLDKPAVRTSLDWLEKAAAHGYGNAEYMLGKAHWYGYGYDANPDDGVALFYRAANHGVAKAQYTIGMMYELGFGLPVNHAKALSWLEKASANGSYEADFILAVKYADGIGVAKDSLRAGQLAKRGSQFHAWSQILAEPEYHWAFGYKCQSDYDMTYIMDVNDEEGETMSVGSEFWEADEKDRAELLAKAQLDDHVEKALDYPIDYGFARMWLESVAHDAQNHTAQMALFGAMGFHNCNVDATAKAFWLFKNAIESGNADAYRGMAEYLAKDAFKKCAEASDCPDEKKSALAAQIVKWYRKAAQNGDSIAQSRLEDIYSGSEDYSKYLFSESEVAALEKKYGDAVQTEDWGTAADSASEIISQYGIVHNSEKAIEWHVKRLDILENKLSFASPVEKNLALLDARNKLASLYSRDDKGQEALDLQNKNLAMIDAMQKDGTLSDDIRARFVDSLKLLEALYGWDRTVPNDPGKSTDALWKSALIRQDFAIAKPQEAQRIHQIIDSEFDNNAAQLRDTLRSEIQLEAGKDPNNFFVVKSGFIPCRDAHAAGGSCPDAITALYRESIEKAIVGIGALSIATYNDLNTHFIEEAFFYLAILYGRDAEFRKELTGYSPGMTKIGNEGDFLTPEEYEKLFYIWYLRQIPYAAEERYKRLSMTTPWKSLLEQAKKKIADIPSLRPESWMKRKYFWGWEDNYLPAVQ